MSDKLTTALQKLAISSVKADRLAIYRLEKEYGASLSEIVGELEDYAIVHESISDERAKPKNQFIIVCCYGAQLSELRRYLSSPALLWRRLGWVLRLGYLGNCWFKKGNKSK